MPATTISFKPPMDKPAWSAVAPSPSTGVAASCLAADGRNDKSRDPSIFELISNAIVNEYLTVNDGWSASGRVNPGLGGTFGAGAATVFVPHRGPRGTISSVSSPSSGIFQCTLSTLELSATAVANQFADRGDGQGYKIRFLDTTNGKTIEGFIIANSALTTPVVVVQLIGTTAPATGSSYEMLSGRVYLLGSGTLAATCWQYYDVALNLMSGSLTVTNLPASLATDSNLICLDEQYVPSSQSPGLGFYGLLTATGSAGSTITGQASSGDAGVLINEYRNFQIRIISDSVTPGSVGQRRRITSHTAGASAVYTVSLAWTTQPSSSAVFVIEYPNEIILTTGGQTSTYAYHSDTLPYNVTANTWDTTTWAARGTTIGAGACCFLAYGVSQNIVAGITTAALYGTNDLGKNFRYSYIYSFRGGAVVTLDLFDIAGAATGAWTSAATYAGSLDTFTTGACGCYDGVTLNGQYAYINFSGGQYYKRFNVFTRTVDAYAFLRYPAAAGVVGNKMACVPWIDPGGSGANVQCLYTRKQTAATTGASTEMFKSLVLA